jgi:hypothetical protein
MKKLALFLSAFLIIVIMTGCASNGNPDVTLKQAFAKNLSTNGYNYQSEIKINKLDIKKENTTEKDERVMTIIQGLSVAFNGAVDSTNAREEIIFDFRYNQNNVDASIKFPVLVDYKKQRIYIGKSIINTLFLPPKMFEKTIMLDFSKNSQLSQKLNRDKSSKVLMSYMQNYLNEEYFRKQQESYKKAYVDAFSDINNSNFKYTDLNKKQIRITLNNKDSANLISTLVGAIVANKLNVPEDKDTPAPLSGSQLKNLIMIFLYTINLQTTIDSKIDNSGYVDNNNLNFNISDIDKKKFDIDLGINTSYSNFNNPHFSVDTKNITQDIDIDEIIKMIKTKSESKKQDSKKKKKK